MTRLTDLLPDVLLTEDATLPDRPLLRLLEVLDGGLDELRAAVEQLARDPFVARCSPAALPLLAELVGARLVGDDPATARAVVAGTVGWRRRQGTPGTLEEVLGRTSGWPAEVDEGYRSLLVTQELDEPLPARGWTVLLDDPIASADPLTRPARRGPRHPSRALTAPAVGDDVTAQLRRLGAADALRPAASPRTVDLGGWAHPDVVLVRTSRAAIAEREHVVLPPALDLIGPAGPGSLLGLTLDPAGQDGPVAARVPAGRATVDAGITSVHETPPEPLVARRPELLTPTDLADDPLAVAEGDALTLTVDDVALLGAAPTAAGPGATGALAFGAPGAGAVLRFADAGRPGPGEAWELELLAIGPDAAADEDVDLADPAVAPPALLARVDATSATLEVSGSPAGLSDVAALRLRRVAGGELAWRRTGAGVWSAGPLEAHPGEPVSACVVLAGPPEEVVRLVRTDEAAVPLGLARHVPGDPDWRTQPLDLDPLPAQDRPGVAWLEPGPAATLVPDGADLLLLAPGAAGTRLRAWRLSDLGSPVVTVTVLDAADGRRPVARAATAACLAGGALTVHGGEAGGTPLLDLWQLPLTGPGAGRWVQRRVRGRIARSGGVLLVGPQGLVRVGGAGEGPGLSAEVAVIDLDRARPAWEPRPPLPGVPAGSPGAAWCRIDAAGDLEAIVWSDRTRPATFRAPAGGDWTAGDLELAAPNPPAEGEVVPLADGWLVAGAAPLPGAEIVVSVGGIGRLLFAPALDPAHEPAPGGSAPDPDRRTVLLPDADGGTRRWFPGGEIARPRLRFGRNREQGATFGRPAPDVPRIGAAGRLAWTPLQVRQASLGPWAGPLALRLDDTVAFDPRLGRLALSAGLGGVRPPGDRPRFTASYHVARGVAFGAGFMRARGVLPDRWLEPPDPADPDRYRLPTAPSAGLASVLVGPPGRPDEAFGGGAEVLTGLEPALEAVATVTGPATVAVVGSPRLPAATVTVREAETTTVLARDTGGYPYVVPDDAGVSLSLLERADAAGARRGPHVLLQGLALGGALEIALTAGEIDLRWCDLGSPWPAADPEAEPPDPDAAPPGARPALLAGGAGPGTAVGVRVAGAGRRTVLPRGGAAAVTLVLRLHGCRVGRLEVPPWVRVLAAGCTFDAGSRRATAIAAAGAALRLRECTVRGRVEAGVLEASSSVFGGEIHAGRPDLGWLRRCVTPLAEDRRPRAWRGVGADVSFAEGRPCAPRYLVLDDNNPAEVLVAGEDGRPPGAHAERGRSLRELDARSADLLPLGLRAQHRDRVADDVYRMGRNH